MKKDGHKLRSIQHSLRGLDNCRCDTMRIKSMGLSNVKKVYKPVLHGVGWPRDVKRIALKIDKTKKLEFRPA